MISSPTGNNDDDRSSITCTNTTYPTLVSCGFSKFNDPTSNAVDGGFMNKNGTVCMVQNGGWQSDTPSVAYAR